MNSSYQQHISSGLALAEKVSINLDEPQLHVKGADRRCAKAFSDKAVEKFTIDDLKDLLSQGAITKGDIIQFQTENLITPADLQGEGKDEKSGSSLEEITKLLQELDSDKDGSDGEEAEAEAEVDVATDEQTAKVEDANDKKTAERSTEPAEKGPDYAQPEVDAEFQEIAVEDQQDAATNTGYLANVVVEQTKKETEQSTNDNPATNTPPTLVFGLAAQDILTEGSTGLTLPLFDSVIFNTHEAGQYVNAIQLSITNIGNVGSESIFFDDSLVNLVDGTQGSSTANGFNYNISFQGTTATITINGFNAAGQAAALLNNVAYQNGASSYAVGDRVFSLDTISDSGGPEQSQTNLSATVTLNKPTTGDDFLMGSAGDDTLSGNTGNDTFLVNSSNWSPNDIIDGGDGNDILSIVSPDTSIDLTTIIAGNTTNIEQIDLSAPFANVKLDGLAVKELTNSAGNLFIEGSIGNSVTLEGAAFALNVSSPNYNAYIFSIPVGQFTEDYYIHVNSDITIDLI